METIPDWAQDAPSVPDWAQPNPRDFIKPAPGELVNPVSTKSRLGAGTQLLPTAKDISNALPDAETVHEVAADVTRPAVALPKFTVNPNDSKVMAVAKSAANLGISLPEFAESPLGVATMGAGSVMPRVVAALFAADTGRNVKQQASELGSQWDTLTPAQKAAALTDITGNTLLTATLGHGATKGRVTPSDVQLEAKPLPDTPVKPVVQAVKPTPPPVEAASPDALAGLQTAMRQRQLAPKTPVQPSAATGATLTPPPAESVPTGNVGANKAIPPLLPGDRLVTIQRPDGTTYQAAYGGKVHKGFGENGEDIVSIAKPTPQGWSHGVLAPGEKIVEATDNPPTVKEGGSPAKDAPVSAGGNAGNLSNPAGEKVSSLPIKSNENESSPRSSAIPQPSQPAPASPVKSALIRQGTGESPKLEPWQMTKKQFQDNPVGVMVGKRKAYYSGIGGSEATKINSLIDATHLKAVQDAVKAGKPVPLEVAESYPNILSYLENRRSASEVLDYNKKAAAKARQAADEIQRRWDHPEPDSIAPIFQRVKFLQKRAAELESKVKQLEAQPTPKPSTPAATPAAAVQKVATQVQKVAKTEGVADAKAVKSELVQRLEKAIEDAPAEADLNEAQRAALSEAKSPRQDGNSYGSEEEKKAIAQANRERATAAKQAAIESGVSQTTIHIPGDGTFTIWNTKEALTETLERAKKIKTESTAPNKTAFTNVKPTGNIPADVWVESSEPTHEVTIRATVKKSGKEEVVMTKRKGKPITIKGFEDKPLFLTSDGETFSVTEPDTGLRIGGGKTIPEAIKDVQSKKQLMAEKFDAAKKHEIAQHGKAPAPVPLESADLSSGKLGKTAISRGPGAAAADEPGTYSPIQQMADRLSVAADKGKPIDTQLHLMDKARAKLADVKDSVKRSLATLTAVKDAIWNKYTGLPEYGDEQRAVGKWFYALQRADAEARNFAKQIVKAVPDKLRREAITNWIQADGDAAVLRQRADASTGTLKQGYEAAMNLKPHEVEIAGMLRDYYDQQLQNGIDAGILKDGLENYITQVWKKENPITRKLVSDLAFGKLQPNFKYAKKRIFDSYFEGEQAGYIPQKDAGFLVANYDQSFNKSLAARAFIKDLHEGKASDGRPLVELSGNGKVLEQTDGRSLEQGKTVFIKPHAKPEELNDYRTIDHPALRGWKWAGNTPEGSPIIMQGDMLVHPEAYQKLKNRLSVSAFRQLPATRALLGVQTGIKQTMLSISGFHQVQETLHALGHRVNPMNLPELDFSEPVTRSLVEHGLQLADYNALADFGEGLAGGGLTAKIPGIGPKLNQYNEWLFQDYIPRLKLGMAKEALERNQKRYPNLPGDKVLELTAGEANAAFGELPYKYWGRSPTLQDALRTFLLAPDFLEARARFTGRALSPFGREQLVALGLLAATQYIAARIANYTISKDPHWEPKNAFRIVAGGHAYGLRTIPSDMLHLFTDTRGFFYNRMSPMLRTATEYITARDAQGVKRDIMEQVKDLAKMPIPISMRSRLGQKWWEAFLNSFGVQEQRYDAVQTIQQKAAEWKQAQGIKNAVEITYNADADKYAALRSAIEDGQQARAQQEFDKLKATMPPAKIYEHFKLSETHPITGSRANDAKFVASLDEAGKQEYQEAQQLRQARLRMVQSLK